MTHLMNIDFKLQKISKTLVFHPYQIVSVINELTSLSTLSKIDQPNFGPIVFVLATLTRFKKNIRN